MPSLYVLDNPRRRYHRRRSRRNPDGTFAMDNPRRRYHRRRNPDIPNFGPVDLEDVALAAAAMVGVQKIQEMLPENMRTGFLDPVSALAITAGAAIMLKDERKIARAIATGGGVASMLKVAAQIPALQNFVSPGSLVIGRHKAPVMLPPTSAPVGNSLVRL